MKSDRPGKFPNLEVKYMGGQMPQIKLLEGDDSVAETLSITKVGIISFIMSEINH